MKHTLLNKTVFKGGKLLMPGETVDATKEELIEWGELDADGNAIAASAPVQATPTIRLPDDARERLMGLERMSEKRADEIIEALTADAPAPAEPAPAQE